MTLAVTTIYLIGVIVCAVAIKRATIAEHPNERTTFSHILTYAALGLAWPMWLVLWLVCKSAVVVRVQEETEDDDHG